VDSALKDRTASKQPPAILVVDDHPANLLALEALLQPLGHQVVWANSGEEALRKVHSQDFAVILLDVQMPGLDGFQTARLIKQSERSRSTPIIFLTALSRDASHVFEGYSHGAVDYLLKPFDPEVLRSKVSVFVELFARGEEIRRQAELLRERDREVQERRSELRFRTLTDAMPISLWVTDAQGDTVYRNRVWLDYRGLSPGLSEGSEMDGRIFHPEESLAARQGWEASLASGEPFQMELRLRGAEGVHRWHLLRACAEREVPGARPVRWVVTAVDVHDAKLHEQALAQTNEAKDAFLAAASHELRTPLQAAKGYAHLATLRLGGESDTPLGRAVRMMGRQVDRMSKLVEELLDISRIQGGRLSLELSTFDLGQLVREAVERTVVASGPATVEVRVPLGVTVEADQGRVDQVITNLVSNAIRYSPEGGLIEVELQATSGGVSLRVRDRGLGIPPEKQREIFERFARAHGPSYGGLGLGLTIAQGIVEQHGGRIEVESSGRGGEGSTFTVSLPRKGRGHSSEPHPSAEWRPAVVTRLEGRRSGAGR
jgi:PAS domain S-box-containing protein